MIILLILSVLILIGFILDVGVLAAFYRFWWVIAIPWSWLSYAVFVNTSDIFLTATFLCIPLTILYYICKYFKEWTSYLWFDDKECNQTEEEKERSLYIKVWAIPSAIWILLHFSNDMPGDLLIGLLVIYGCVEVISAAGVLKPKDTEEADKEEEDT